MTSSEGCVDRHPPTCAEGATDSLTTRAGHRTDVRSAGIRFGGVRRELRMCLALAAFTCLVVALVLIAINGHVVGYYGPTPENVPCASIWQAWTKGTSSAVGAFFHSQCGMQRQNRGTVAAAFVLVGIVLAFVARSGQRKDSEEPHDAAPTLPPVADPDRVRHID